MVQRNLLPAMVLSIMAALFCQLHGAHADGEYYTNVVSAMMNGREPDTRPSPNPTFLELVDAAQTEVVDRRVMTLDDFDVGYKVEWTFLAPNAGRVSMNLMDELGQNVILHVDARYDWHSSKQVLVLNTFQGSWGQEERPDGYDFAPGILVKVRVEAGPNSFRIFSNSHQIAEYKYRMPVTLVKMVEMRFQDHFSTESAKLKSMSVTFPQGGL